MRRFTLFTLLYLATGICLTAIALQYPDMTPNAKTSLLLAAGLLYLCAVFTTFPFWHQSVQRSQARLRDRPAWQQNLCRDRTLACDCISAHFSARRCAQSQLGDRDTCKCGFGSTNHLSECRKSLCQKPNPSIISRTQLGNVHGVRRH